MASGDFRRSVNGVYPGFTHEKEGEWKGNFTFIQGADTQFGLIDRWFLKNPIENNVWDQEIELTKQAIKHANEMVPKPKFFILCGDLIDAMPHTKHRGVQEEDFKKLFSELDSEIPLVCVCGNHDVGDIPTKESLESYRAEFGDDYFTFCVGGVFFIIVNSQLFKNHVNVREEYEAHLKWIDRQLEVFKSSKCKHCLVFQHIPWFREKADEVESYFNINPELRFKMMDKFLAAGVRHVFCGHIHQNAGGWYKDLEIVVTSAIGCQTGEDKSGFRLVRVAENRIDHKYYNIGECPKHFDLDEKNDLP